MAEPEPVLVSALRRGSRLYPWPGEVVGGCIALRAGRVAATLGYLPIILLQIMKVPGTNAFMRRWSPIGTLAYGPDIAALGLQLDGIRGAGVHVDWSEAPRDVRLVTRGWLVALLEINGRPVRVDRRCASALIGLWS